MASKIYHVMPENGEWKVQLKGGKRATSRHPTKTEAIAKATQLARAPQTVHVVIHRRNGTVQQSHTYK